MLQPSQHINTMKSLYKKIGYQSAIVVSIDRNGGAILNTTPSLRPRVDFPSPKYGNFAYLRTHQHEN